MAREQTQSFLDSVVVRTRQGKSNRTFPIKTYAQVFPSHLKAPKSSDKAGESICVLKSTRSPRESKEWPDRNVTEVMILEKEAER